MQLEPEQIDLLRELAEAARSVPREKRSFILIPTSGGAVLKGPGGRSLSQAEEHDLQDLVSADFLRVRRHGKGGAVQFAVAPDAYAFLAEDARGQPLARVEDEVVDRYIDEPGFRDRFPRAYQRWKEAAALLWSEDPDAELTTIGHKTREAVQEFATALVESHAPQEVDPDPAHTVNRLHAIIDGHRERLGEARHELLDALVNYWREVNDLLQRQEHGGQKEGEPLSWEDGRRAVFQTAVVMYEIDRTL